ncbi:uncharacterized protein LOC144102242 [Amblyomma americanum]
MLYRQQLVAEDPCLGIRRRQTGTIRPGLCRCLGNRLSESHSSSDVLGTHLVLTSEAMISPSTSDWRYDSSDDVNGQPPVKWRSPERVVRESGTFHKSLRLSAVRRAARVKAAPKPPRAVLPSKAVLPSVAARSSPPPLPRHDNARAAAAESKSPGSPVEAPDYALHIIGDLFRELEHPAYSALRRRPEKARTDLAESRQQLPGQPSSRVAPPAEGKAMGPSFAAAAEHVLRQGSPILRADKRAPSEEPVGKEAVAKSTASDAALAGHPLPEGQPLPPPLPTKETARPGQPGLPTPVERRAASRGSLEAGAAHRYQGERPQHDLPRRQSGKSTAHKAKTLRSPRDFAVSPRRPSLPPDAGGKNTPPDAAFPAPSQKGLPESASKRLEVTESLASPPDGAGAVSPKAPGKKTSSHSVSRPSPPKASAGRKTAGSRKKMSGTDDPMPPSAPEGTDKGQAAPAKTAVASDEPPLPPNQEVAPKKPRSPVRKTRRGTKPDGAVPDRRAHLQKAGHAKLSAARLSNAASSVVDASSAPAVPLSEVAPKPKAKKSKGRKHSQKGKAHHHALPEAGGSKAQDNNAVAASAAGGSSKAPSAAPQPPRRSQRDSTSTDPAGKLAVARSVSASQPGGVQAGMPPSSAKQAPVTAKPHNAEGAKRVDGVAGSGRGSLKNDRVGMESSAPDGVPRRAESTSAVPDGRKQR